MMYALAPPVTTVGASGSHGQERMPRARVLWDCLHRSQPDRATPRDGSVARQKCALLQSVRLHGDLEQPSRVGGHGRLHMVA